MKRIPHKRTSVQLKGNTFPRLNSAVRLLALDHAVVQT